MCAAIGIGLAVFLGIVVGGLCAILWLVYQINKG